MSEPIKETIKLFLDKGYLINPDLIEKSELDLKFLDDNLKKNESGELLVFNEDMLRRLLKKSEDESEEIKLVEDSIIENGVKIIKSEEKYLEKIKVQDFVMHYQKRYESLNFNFF
jgi:hypothetical protein